MRGGVNQNILKQISNFEEERENSLKIRVLSTRGHAERDNTIEIRIQNRDRIQKSKTWKHGVSGVSLLEFAFFKASTHLQSTVPERWWLFTYFGEGDWLVDL